MQDAAVREQVQSLDELLGRVQELSPGQDREVALEAIEGLLRLYGEALRRIATTASPELLQSLERDELVSQLMLLHDLHPAPLEERIAEALEEVRPYMGSHGGGIELVEVRDGVARVRLEGTCSGCAASTLTLKLAVEEAILRAAPELAAVEAIEQEETAPAALGVSLPMFDAALAPAPAGRWLGVGELEQLAGDGPLLREVGGSALIFARGGGELYAYLDRCPACRGPFEQPYLDGETLGCAGCGRRYDLRRAGVALDGGLLQLDPVPLLVEQGRVRVAVEAVPA